MTRDEIMKIIEEENIHFFRLQFVDIFGFMKNVAIPRSQIEKALDGKIMFDGSSIEGFVRINESDMYLKPDYDTFVVLPWRNKEGIAAAARRQDRVGFQDQFTSDIAAAVTRRRNRGQSSRGTPTNSPMTDTGNGFQDALDLEGGYILATCDDHFVGPPADRDRSVRIYESKVTGGKPTIGTERRYFVPMLQVAGHQGRPFHLEPSAASAHTPARERNRRAGRGAWNRCGDLGAGLGHSPCFEHRNSTAQGLRPQRLGRRRTAQQDCP